MLYTSFGIEYHRSALRIQSSTSNVLGFMSLEDSTLWADIVQSWQTMNAVRGGVSLRVFNGGHINKRSLCRAGSMLKKESLRTLVMYFKEPPEITALNLEEGWMSLIFKQRLEPLKYATSCKTLEEIQVVQLFLIKICFLCNQLKIGHLLEISL